MDRAELDDFSRKGDEALARLNLDKRMERSRRRARRWMAIVAFGLFVAQAGAGALLFAVLALLGAHTELAALSAAIKDTSTYWLSAMGSELFIVAGYLGISGVEAIVRR